MKRTATLAIAAIGCLLTASARNVTIEECAALARENYPAIAQYGIIAATRDYTLSNASRAWLPQASLTGKVTWQSRVPELPDQLTAMMHQQGVDYPGMKKLQYGTSLEVSQAIWDGGTTAARRAEARAEANTSARATDLTLYEVTGRVQEIYFAAILISKQREQVKLTEALLDSTLNRINAMVTNGIAMQSDADEVEAQLLGCRQTIASLEAQAEAYTKVLGIYIGLYDTPLELTEPSALPPVAEQKPQAELFDARLRLINAGRKSINAAIMPHIGAFATASYGYPGMNMFQSMRSSKADFGLMIGLNFKWNIGAFYTRSNSMKLLDARSRQIETDRATADFATRLAAESIEGEISALRTSITDDERITSLRSKVRLAAETQLTEGVIDTNTLLQKITAEESARMALQIHKIQLLNQIYKHSHTVNK